MDPGQLAALEASCSGSTLFSKELNNFEKILVCLILDIPVKKFSHVETDLA